MLWFLRNAGFYVEQMKNRDEQIEKLLKMCDEWSDLHNKMKEQIKTKDAIIEIQRQTIETQRESIGIQKRMLELKGMK